MIVDVNERGLPLHSEVAEIRHPRSGEWFIYRMDPMTLGHVGGARLLDMPTPHESYPVLRFSHAYGQMPLDNVRIPKNFEYDGESLAEAYRTIQEKDKYFISARVVQDVLLADDSTPPTFLGLTRIVVRPKIQKTYFNVCLIGNSAPAAEGVAAAIEKLCAEGTKVSVVNHGKQEEL